MSYPTLEAAAGPWLSKADPARCGRTTLVGMWMAGARAEGNFRSCKHQKPRCLTASNVSSLAFVSQHRGQPQQSQPSKCASSYESDRHRAASLHLRRPFLLQEAMGSPGRRPPLDPSRVVSGLRLRPHPPRVPEGECWSTDISSPLQCSAQRKSHVTCRVSPHAELWPLNDPQRQDPHHRRLVTEPSGWSYLLVPHTCRGRARRNAVPMRTPQRMMATAGGSQRPAGPRQPTQNSLELTAELHPVAA
mmetsp:Transcript_67960/g.171364  ORF Transcript_67960/g.171364 Transcript_67960/m.171364 type:complete len:247 (-) Transcript_67960:225-965(-)